ncbi:dihydroorotase [Algoriphagus kandeliae]|uniref:Dihydroorotase n=1 Tax=Algoriphagus kandeliae TaxID=2562278 RepID=A0A4Y9QQ45_9BACT|nr:dihydroorotase [Algoriphagus kandeliae]TFV94764.1 dihydroorotase [Algoriphagus kandeliae]
MAVLFQGLTWIDKGESQKGDFVFVDGQFQLLDSTLDYKHAQIINSEGWLASKGWIDLRVASGEPGLEHKETIETLCDSLYCSGFSTAVMMPNTQPVVQNKSLVDFIKNKSAYSSVELIPQAAVTMDLKGEDLTEMLDMHYQSGVTIFGEGKDPLSNSDRFLKIIQYLQKFNGVLFDHSYDPLLAIFGQMHEGEVSTRLGLKGIPSLAEEVAIQKNLELIRYAGGRVHFQTISTAKSVALIRKAKEEGLNVTADVSIYQLIFSDGDLVEFDPNLKVLPPFRSENDRMALLEGLKDGTIDAIVSNHQPEDYDSKFMEFDLAAFGMAGLQTFLPAMVKLEKELGWELMIEKLTDGPLEVLGRTSSNSITIFDPKESWIYDHPSNRSLSFNHPWFGKELTGKVKYRIYDGVLSEIDD